jgi:hypothetical protein
MSVSRKFALVFAILAAGVLLFAGFAWPGSGTPWSPQSKITFSSAAALSRTSSLTPVGQASKVVGADASGVGMVLNEVPVFDAAQFEQVVFRIDSLAVFAKPMFVWRREGQLHMMPLYRTWFGAATVPLADSPEWHGRIDAIGIAVMPTDYLHARAVVEPHFVLRGLRLESRSWRGALRSLASRWMAYRPWNGRSNHTGGFELSAHPGESRQAFIAAWLAVALALSFLLGGRASRGMVWPLCFAAAAILGLQQLAQLAERARVANAARSLVVGRPEMPLAAQPQIGVAAHELSAQLDAMSPAPRVMVFGSSLFLQEYPTYLLRRHDAATLPSPAALPSPEKMPEAILVLVGEGDWQWDSAASELQFGAHRWKGSLFFDGGVLRAYRIGGGVGS